MVVGNGQTATTLKQPKEVYLSQKQAAGTLGIGLTMLDRLVQAGHLTITSNGATNPRGQRYSFNQKQVLELRARMDAGTFNITPLKKVRGGRPKGVPNQLTGFKLWRAIDTISDRLGNIEKVLEKVSGVTSTTPTT